MDGFPAPRELGKEDFPGLLNHIPDPPKKLWVCGDVPRGIKLLAVVGSRAATEYGRIATKKIISELAGSKVAIVSGLALGIDACAHEVALNSGLTTVAVPGSGLDISVLYPRSHVGLASRIITAGGALLSEYEPRLKAAPWTFPRRNRIMAGMCDAILVIEAGLPSGSLITAKLATEYDRDVLAVPGSIFEKGSSGTNNLIGMGAAVIQNGDDVLRCLGLPERTRVIPDSHSLAGDELLIYRSIRTGITRDDLVRATGIPAYRVLIAIASLDLKGFVEETGGMIVTRG
jgi:DNA processing protein